MQKKQSFIDFIVVAYNDLDSLIIDNKNNLIVLLTDDGETLVKISCNIDNALNTYNQICAERNIKDILFIAREDAFSSLKVRESLKSILGNKERPEIMLLTPYLPPPVQSAREDGKVQSFIIKREKLNFPFAVKHIEKYDKLIYYIVYEYLNTPDGDNIEVVQVDKPCDNSHKKKQKNHHLINNSMLLIPHKGTVKLLKRCISHLSKTPLIPGQTTICFDDKGYKKPIEYNINSHIDLFFNSPLGVGPYLARHYSIVNSEKKYVFFQDSDDISVRSRFKKQLNELKRRDLDMIGSHELRIDQMARCIMVVRFPIDVNKALENNGIHPLFHPTSMISRSGYLKTKGFSTNLKFSYDLQFLMRAFFFLKIGNIDEFLYIRFKRQNSLITHHKTGLNTPIRSFLLWRWMVDLKLIKENKLDLEDSSLSLQKHEFNYQLLKYREQH